MASILQEAMPSLLSGLAVTIELTAGSFAIGFGLGLLLAVARIYGGPVLGLLAKGYGRVMRSIPEIALVIMLYLMINSIVNLSPAASVIWALGLHSGAYQAEIIRSAIGAVASGEVKAGQTLGMSNCQVFLYIILPQLLRNAIPGWSNEISIVLKDTAVGFVVGATELLRQASYISARNHEVLLMYCLAGLIYFILTTTINRVLAYAEVRYAIPKAGESGKASARA